MIQELNPHDDYWDNPPEVFDTLSASPSPLVPSLCVSESRDVFTFREFNSPTRSDSGSKASDFMMQNQRSTPEPEAVPVTPQSTNSKIRKPLISPRRLSVALVESVGQLDIPFLPKRKSSAPVCRDLDQENVARLKQKYNDIREVRRLSDFS